MNPTAANAKRLKRLSEDRARNPEKLAIGRCLAKPNLMRMDRQHSAAVPIEA
jgi:hypothetical protein